MITWYRYNGWNDMIIRIWYTCLWKIGEDGSGESICENGGTPNVLDACDCPNDFYGQFCENGKYEN